MIPTNRARYRDTVRCDHDAALKSGERFDRLARDRALVVKGRRSGTDR